MKYIFLLYNTLRHLKATQIIFQLWYRIRIFNFKNSCYNLCVSKPLRWINQFYPSKIFFNHNEFVFLNIKESFNSNINWNYSAFGKLWAYNLNYFDFLNQEDLKKDEGLTLIYSYIKFEKQLTVGLEPYPVSLRLINWIKFISRHQIRDVKIDSILAKHLSILNKNLEYHLLGNHLLENAFALLFGAYYFRNNRVYMKSKSLLIRELNEQILSDGGHFELSPMYHKLILTRLLDSILLIELNPWKEDNLLKILREKSEKMLSWLYQVTYKNGETPMVNDSTHNISLSSKDLFNYSKNLKINSCNISLNESGYRRWSDNCVEIFMDIGPIGPDYIPGHAHADTFNFEFLYKERPIIVDLGISTYEKNSRRQLERSTEYHNTIRIDENDSSEVWGGFRVGQRAKIISFKEKKNKITATHDGYKRIGALHSRRFEKLNQKLIVEDIIESKKSHQIESFLHFHPDCRVSIEKNKLMVDSDITIVFRNYKSLTLEEYDFSAGYNQTKKAYKIRASVERKSKIEISYEN